MLVMVDESTEISTLVTMIMVLNDDDFDVFGYEYACNDSNGDGL